MTERRITTVLAALIPLLVLALLGMFVTVPYVAVGPGDTADTLGDYKGKQVVTVKGLPVHRPAGQLRFTTVAVTDGLNLYGALGMWLKGNQLAPRDAYYRPGQSREQIEEGNREQFVGSESSATVAALRYLKVPTAIGVTGLVKGGPSDGKLRSGDVLQAVDGAPVAAPDTVSKAIEGKKAGDTVTLSVLRADGPAQVPVVLADKDGKPRLGVLVGQVPADPKVEVGFGVDQVGGPSAGLMLTLGIIDMVEPGDLTGGRVVAGTGEIGSDGAVGPIGGISHKLEGAKRDGATVFLVPARNCAEAKTSPPADLQLVKVDNLDGAITALSDVREGRPAPSC
ncbi:YlbL family protein [Tsukamurella strandjordii]|uniref:endopeptidase La n=1 Tax=Tsukamurella strandjordii TaxID=147577 RepID=A0AA90NBI6_9ACTN|nr:S16 family serine protease [Tsukamurella strandjordii]MDP0399256.1 PDZ domain-containing protein [Tsukamurella strandjordii]